MKCSIPIRHRSTGGAHGESGVALIMALICLFVVSTLAVGVLYSTQSEIWTTGNYRATTQARYIAEAGAQQALTYLQTQGPIIGTTAAFPASFNLNIMPIQYTSTSKPIIMATAGISSKYADTYGAIDSATDNTFLSYFSTTLTQSPFANLWSTPCSGSACPHYNVAVQLLSAKVATGVSGTHYLSRWKIVSEGALSTVGSNSTGTGQAMVQVVEVVDNVTVVNSGSSSAPTFTAGVFATGTLCSPPAISMSGGQYTNGYTSTGQIGVTSPTLLNTNGNVGALGNISVTHGAYVLGNVYSPFYNVGANNTYGISGGPSGLNGSAACVIPPGGTEWAVNEDNSGSGVGCTSQSAGSCSQKTYPLPTPVPNYPTPTMPSVATNTAAPTSSSGGIWYGLLGGGSGGGNGCAVTVAPSGGTAGSFTSPANFGAVNMGSCAVITLQAGTYNMDSLYISNGAKVILPASGNVVINILDQGSTTNPFNVDGGTFSNGGGAPIHLTVVYAGTKQIDINAGANMFGTIYAPNASAIVTGNAGIYGAMVINNVQFQGSGHVIYDTALNGQAINVTTGAPPSTTVGNLHIDEFSWSAF